MFKLKSMNYDRWSTPSISIGDGDTTVNFALTEEDKAEIEALAIRLWEKRQPAVVQAVQQGVVALPAPAEAEYTEVEPF